MPMAGRPPVRGNAEGAAEGVVAAGIAGVATLVASAAGVPVAKSGTTGVACASGVAGGAESAPRTLTNVCPAEFCPQAVSCTPYRSAPANDPAVARHLADRVGAER